MLALALALSAAAQTPPDAGDISDTSRTAVRQALINAQIATLRIGHCTAELPARADLEEDYQALSSRLLTISTLAEGLYPDIDVVMEAVVRTTGVPPPRCSRVAVRDYVADARRSLDAADAGIRADLARRGNGLWLGNLHLCAGTVIAVESGEPRYQGDRPGITFQFSLTFAPRVRALTARLVRKPLPLILDGVIVASPIVMEPVADAVSLHGGDALSVDAMRRATATPC